MCAPRRSMPGTTPAADLLDVFGGPSRTHGAVGGGKSITIDREVRGAATGSALESGSSEAPPLKHRPAASFGRGPRFGATSVTALSTSACTHAEPSAAASFAFGRSVRDASAGASLPSACAGPTIVEEPEVVRRRRRVVDFGKGESRKAASLPTWQARPDAPELVPEAADPLVKPRPAAVYIPPPPPEGEQRGPRLTADTISNPGPTKYAPSLEAVHKRAPTVVLSARPPTMLTATPPSERHDAAADASADATAPAAAAELAEAPPRAPFGSTASQRMKTVAVDDLEPLEPTPLDVVRRKAPAFSFHPPPSESGAPRRWRPAHDQQGDGGGDDEDEDGEEAWDDDEDWDEDLVQPSYALVERRAPSASFGGGAKTVPRVVPPTRAQLRAAEAEAAAATAGAPEAPRTPPRTIRGGAFFGRSSEQRKPGWIPQAGAPPPAVPPSPAPTELSDAATDIAPLSELDAAVRPRVPTATIRPRPEEAPKQVHLRRQEVLEERRGPGKYGIPRRDAVERRVAAASFGSATTTQPRRRLADAKPTPAPGAYSLPGSINADAIRGGGGAWSKLSGRDPKPKPKPATATASASAAAEPSAAAARAADAKPTARPTPTPTPTLQYDAVRRRSDIGVASFGRPPTAARSRRGDSDAAAAAASSAPPAFYDVRHSLTERRPRGGSFGPRAPVAKPLAPPPSARALRAKSRQIDLILRGKFDEVLGPARPHDPSHRDASKSLVRYASPVRESVAPRHAPLRADIHPAAPTGPQPLPQPGEATTTTSRYAREPSFSFGKAVRLIVRLKGGGTAPAETEADKEDAAPGPGAYDYLAAALGLSVVRPPAFSFGGKGVLANRGTLPARGSLGGDALRLEVFRALVYTKPAVHALRSAFALPVGRPRRPLIAPPPFPPPPLVAVLLLPQGYRHVPAPRFGPAQPAAFADWTPPPPLRRSAADAHAEPTPSPADYSPSHSLVELRSDRGAARFGSEDTHRGLVALAELLPEGCVLTLSPERADGALYARHGALVDMGRASERIVGPREPATIEELLAPGPASYDAATADALTRPHVPTPSFGGGSSSGGSSLEAGLEAPGPTSYQPELLLVQRRAPAIDFGRAAPRFDSKEDAGGGGGPSDGDVLWLQVGEELGRPALVPAGRGGVQFALQLGRELMRAAGGAIITGGGGELIDAPFYDVQLDLVRPSVPQLVAFAQRSGRDTYDGGAHPTPHLVPDGNVLVLEPSHALVERTAPSTDFGSAHNPRTADVVELVREGDVLMLEPSHALTMPRHDTIVTMPPWDVGDGGKGPEANATRENERARRRRVPRKPPPQRQFDDTVLCEIEVELVRARDDQVA